jgi:hypothetical protein
MESKYLSWKSSDLHSCILFICPDIIAADIMTSEGRPES